MLIKNGFNPIRVEAIVIMYKSYLDSFSLIRAALPRNSRK